MNKLTLDKLMDYCMDIVSAPISSDRKIEVAFGKYGYISFRKALMESSSMNKKDIDIKIKKLEKELPSGVMYYVD